MRASMKIGLGFLALLGMFQISFDIVQVVTEFGRTITFRSALTGTDVQSGNDSSVNGLLGVFPTINGSVPRETVTVHGRACPETSPGLLGALKADLNESSPQFLEKKFSFLKPGGDYHPPDCLTDQRTAIIIPYRNRWPHLHLLLNNLIPFLVRQQASFTIYVIELKMPTTFNRALLLNIGVLESLKRDNYTCFVFHDVDLIPLNDHNLYRCGPGPRHLAAAINKFGYSLPYSFYTGGVSALSRDQVFKINGNSNLYFGWGGEDDDGYYRIHRQNMTIHRYPMDIARYHMIKHDLDKGNEVNPMRIELLKTAAERMWEDGLSTASTLYTRDRIELKHLYTWITVSVNMTTVFMNSPAIVRPLLTTVVTNETSKT